MDANSYRVCIPVSGGLDSFTAYHLALNSFGKEEIALLSINMDGIPYADKEWEVMWGLYGLRPNEGIYDGTFFTKEGIRLYRVHLTGYAKIATTEDHVVLGRNAVIASMACALAPHVWIGATSFENNPRMFDKNKKFFRLISTALTQACGYKRTLDTIVGSPFQGGWSAMEKPDMIRYLEKSGHTDWRKTTSCFHPKHVRCGACVVCIKRFIYEKIVEISENIHFSDIAFLEHTYVKNPITTSIFRDAIKKAEIAEEAGKEAIETFGGKDRVDMYRLVGRHYGVWS